MIQSNDAVPDKQVEEKERETGRDTRARVHTIKTVVMVVGVVVEDGTEEKRDKGSQKALYVTLK